ncbi:MAG: hypothetical protein ACXWXQ_02005 [Actinomycetota bacterium]
MTRPRLAPALLVLVLLAAACADEPGRSAATGPTGATGGTDPTGATGPTSGTPAPSETDSPTPEPSPELEDGRHFGFIHEVDAAAATLVLDLAYFLTGDAATEVAVEHGDEAPPPNDYYIVNDNERLRTLALSPDLEIALLDWDRCCDETFLVPLGDFAAAIAADDPVTIEGRLFYGRSSTYWLTVEDGVVRRIEEQYLP